MPTTLFPRNAAPVTDEEAENAMAYARYLRIKIENLNEERVALDASIRTAVFDLSVAERTVLRHQAQSTTITLIKRGRKGASAASGGCRDLENKLRIALGLSPLSENEVGLS